MQVFLLLIVITICIAHELDALKYIPSNPINRFGHTSVDNTRLNSNPTSSITTDQRTEFLLSKEVMKDNSLRSIIFSCLNNPDSIRIDKERNRYKACQARLDRVLSTAGDVTSDVIPNDVQRFEEFCEQYPDWSDPSTSFVFHRDHPKVSGKEGVLQQRAQPSGLCYIHGPDMLQHYLVTMNSPTPVGMIDISKLIRETFSADELEAHIFREEGGDSRYLLERILQPDSIITPSDASFYHQFLKDYGCGLVSKFKVYDDFNDLNVHSHQGKPTGQYRGLHCMVMIGARVDAEGNRWFLIQNWWKRKQFLQVREDYLEACGSIVFFVKTPQYEIPKEFPTNFARYAENENFLDKPESYFLGEKNTNI